MDVSEGKPRLPLAEDKYTPSSHMKDNMNQQS